MPSSPGLFKKYAEALRQAVRGQAGFFTAAQARAAGYADSVHGYHVEKGEWIKCRRGIYRLAELPEPDWPELVVLSLWSRDRHGEPQGVFTHDTARMVHGLIPRRPGPVHMTVPRAFRKNSDTPPGLILHKDNLPPDSWEQRDGFRVATSATLGRTVHPYDAAIRRGED